MTAAVIHDRHLKIFSQYHHSSKAVISNYIQRASFSSARNHTVQYFIPQSNTLHYQRSVFICTAKNLNALPSDSPLLVPPACIAPKNCSIVEIVADWKWLTTYEKTGFSIHSWSLALETKKSQGETWGKLKVRNASNLMVCLIKKNLAALPHEFSQDWSLIWSIYVSVWPKYSPVLFSLQQKFFCCLSFEFTSHRKFRSNPRFYYLIKIFRKHE